MPVGILQLLDEQPSLDHLEPLKLLAIPKKGKIIENKVMGLPTEQEQVPVSFTKVKANLSCFPFSYIE